MMTAVGEIFIFDAKFQIAKILFCCFSEEKKHTAPNRDNRDTKRARACLSVQAVWKATNAAVAESQPKFDNSLSEFDDHDKKIQYAAESQPKFDIKEFNISLSEIDDHDKKVQYACKYLDRYFKLVNDGKSIKVIEYEYEGRFITKHREYTEKCAKARLCKNLIDGKNPFEFFKASDECVMYTSMVFDPTAGPMPDFPHEGSLNTFYGHRAAQVSRWLHELCKADPLRLYKADPGPELLMVITNYIHQLCGGKTKHYDYLLDLLSYPIQTGEKCNIAILQRSRENAFYKDFLANNVYGKEIAVGIAGGTKFTGSLKNRCLIVVDKPSECSPADRKIHKNRITMEDDHANLIFTCDDVPEDLVDVDDEHFFCLEHSREKVPDKFFEAIKDEQTVVDFYDFLKNREIKTFVKGQPALMTPFKKRLMKLNIHPVFLCLTHLVQENKLPPKIENGGSNHFKEIYARRMPVSEFIDHVNERCKSDNKKYTRKEIVKVITDRLEPYFHEADVGDDQFKMFMKQQFRSRQEMCIIFPEPDVLKGWLKKANVYA